MVNKNTDKTASPVVINQHVKDNGAKLTDQIIRREFSMLFDSFEACDVQAVRKESREAGRLENLIENILAFLEDYGNIPDDVQDAITKENNMEKLKIWLKLAARADSIEDFKTKANL